MGTGGQILEIDVKSAHQSQASKRQPEIYFSSR